MTFLLDMHGLNMYGENIVVVPTNQQDLANYNNEMAKSKRIILNGIQYHIIPHVADKNTAKEKWDSITKIY